jgi:hypothetical protein
MARKFKRTPITVRYGRPLRLRGKVARNQYGPAADELMYQLAATLPAHLRGLYADADKATMQWIEYAGPE